MILLVIKPKKFNYLNIITKKDKILKTNQFKSCFNSIKIFVD